MNHFALFIGITVGFSTAPVGAATDNMPPAPWKIMRAEWTTDDEVRFSEFVAALGKSGCDTVDRCMKNPANPYRESDPAGAKFFSDCADFPYFLRLYFAWKNELPFSYTATVRALPDPLSGASAPADVRYSRFGNTPTSRISLLTRVGRAETPLRTNPMRALRDLFDRISSATLRIGPPGEDSAVPTDLYPVAIRPGAIRPGTVIYDPDGHVAVVYAVESDGRVLFIDAHPDQSVTRGTFGKKFARSSPGHGAGFKNWRPIRLVDASRSPEGEWLGGRIVSAKNAELTDYSTEQFYGTAPDAKGRWAKGRFAISGRFVEYYDFVRRALAEGELRYEPMREFSLMIGGICADLRDRVKAVEAAVDAGIDRKPHPPRLPPNIYGTEGEWENYASPSRDARLKVSFIEAYDRVREFIVFWEAGDPALLYSGSDLRKELGDAWRVESAKCVFEYTRSDGSRKALDLAEARRRLFDLSFDPYDCPELRWGARDADELAACRSDPEKRRWYAALKRLRQQPERTYGAKMDYSSEELENSRAGRKLGREKAPELDFEALFL